MRERAEFDSVYLRTMHASSALLDRTRIRPDPVAILRSTGAALQSIDYDPSGKIVFTGDAQGEVRAWGLDDFRPHTTGKLHSFTDGIIHVLHFKTRDKLLTQGRSGCTKLWTVSHEHPIFPTTPDFTFQKASHTFCKCSLLERKASKESSLHTCDCSQSGLCLLAIPDDTGHGADVVCCDCYARVAHVITEEIEDLKLGMLMSLNLFYCEPMNCILLCCGYESGHVVVWSVSEPKVVCQNKLFNEPITALDIDSKGSGGVCCSTEDIVVVFDIKNEGSLNVVYRLSMKKPGGNDVAIRQDDKIMAVAGWDGRVRLYKYKNGKPIAVLKYHSKAAIAVRFGPTTGMMVSTGGDSHAAIWQLDI